MKILEAIASFIKALRNKEQLATTDLVDEMAHAHEALYAVPSSDPTTVVSFTDCNHSAKALASFQRYAHSKHPMMRSIHDRNIYCRGYDAAVRDTQVLVKEVANG